jgi:hypothetical protein
MALEESSSTWTEHFKSLKERGLKTVGLTISAAHKGLVKAPEEEFLGTPHQRWSSPDKTDSQLSDHGHFFVFLRAMIPYRRM